MTYRDRRLAKAERLREWADKRETKAAAAYDRIEEISSMIPLGQPILIGHHSEGRHRKDLARIDTAMSNGVENSRKAESFRSRADNIEAAADLAIYSDDVDATERLAEKLVGLEARRDRIKAYNASCRKGAADTSLLDEEQRADLEIVARVSPYQIGKGGSFPAYALANLSGNISTTRKRLAILEAQNRKGGEVT